MIQVGDKWGCSRRELSERMTCREIAELSEEYKLQSPKKKQARPVPAGLRLKGMKGAKVDKKKE